MEEGEPFSATSAHSGGTSSMSASGEDQLELRIRGVSVEGRATTVATSDTAATAATSEGEDEEEEEDEESTVARAVLVIQTVEAAKEAAKNQHRSFTYVDCASPAAAKETEGKVHSHLTEARFSRYLKKVKEAVKAAIPSGTTRVVGIIDSAPALAGEGRTRWVGEESWLSTCFIGPSCTSFRVTCLTRSGRLRALLSSDLRAKSIACFSVPGETTE